MTFTAVVEHIGQVMDALGVAAIVVGVIFAAGTAVAGLRHRDEGTYVRFRRQLGRSILLGLELLVAADIIRTVAVSPSVKSVLVLGIIVLIRTFLSFSLELEITGAWPWQKRRPPAEAPTT